jgi:uncharacterized protein YdhG (YjbR/CyaY superfamily)
MTTGGVQKPTPTRRKPASVDDYIAGFDAATRAALRAVRRAVRRAAPKTREVISYAMPALKQNGVLVFFAAFKSHIGFYPPVRGDARLTKAAARYAGPKGNLRFPLDEPLPLALIAALTRLRARQDAVQAASRRRARSAARPSRARR